MNVRHNKKLVGIALVVLGVLFLFVSNGILVGWDDVWPLFLIVGGMLFLKVFIARPSAELLFGGLTALLLGVFLFLFTAGFVGWDKMETMWPSIPLIAGVGLAAASTQRDSGSGTLLTGLGVIVFSIVAFMYEGGAINQRVAGPIVRFWPLVLVIAGALMYRRSVAEKLAENPAEVIPDPLAAVPMPADPKVDAPAEPESPGKSDSSN